MPSPFSGSYAPDDVTFLLRPVEIHTLRVDEKERRLLEEGAHYAEMLPEEALPDSRWSALVDDALHRHGPVMGTGFRRLATAISGAVDGEIVLVSLARAGTPTGVVLRRLLAARGHVVTHYSISLVLQRGIDTVALDFIRQHHRDDTIIFVDGWTGKGSIGRELETALASYRTMRGSGPTARLAVLSDLAGVAQLSAFHEDMLIPHALLGAVGSGLISRTLLSDTLVGPGQFHACRYYAEWSGEDRSRSLVEHLYRHAMDDAEDDTPPIEKPNKSVTAALARWLSREHPDIPMGVIKPGLCESLRALLRRTPELVFIRNEHEPDIVPLLVLAERRGAAWRLAPDLPCAAATVIRGPRS
jgi:hypothetical protein